MRRTEFVCVNCNQVGDDVGECFGHPDAEPGWPVFHTAPDGGAA